jgi:phage tail sheath protein FI
MAAYTYPGVYIEEISSGQHTITGVATSIAAFIGWSNQGPVGEAVMVESWAQYQTLFGGMIPGVYLGYAVYQFFLNGGSQAYIVRLFDTDTLASPTESPAAFATGTIAGLQIWANNPGRWGNALCIAVTNAQLVSGGYTTFNLQVCMLSSSGVPSTLESYTNLSTSPASPQYAVTIVNNDSAYITFTEPGQTSPPASFGAISSPLPSAVYIAAGSLTTTALFTSGETVTQTGSSATATVLGTVNGSYLVLKGKPTPSGTNAITSSGAWSGASAKFSPTTVPNSSVAIPLALDGASGAGADGTQLLPNTPEFENQLLNTPTTLPWTSFVTGYPLLANIPIFNLLCVPGENSLASISALQAFCAQSRAFLIVDAPEYAATFTGSSSLAELGPISGDSTPASLVDPSASNSAYYFPWVSAPDPAAGYRPALFPPCGFVAGIYASTDASRGVWKAPAGIEASLTGALGLQYVINDLQNGQLNTWGINCLRQFPNFGNVVWGARTIAGSNALGSQWMYIPIRRLALFIESSLYTGTQWAVFEPNAEPLWGQVRMSIGTFLQGLFLQGAFAGSSPQQAYFVKCDSENNTPATTALGILNITVGFAPLYPAEFVVIQIQQMMNQS